MTSFKLEFLEEARVKGLLEGQDQGRSEWLLRILASRGIRVDESTRQRILACRDLAILDQWLERALKATTLSDLEEVERNG